MKKLLLLLLFPFIALSQSNKEKPKLIIGIVVDQMRYDYIERFWDDFSEDGFKKLINEGHLFRNMRFGYVPTYTGPGHASIFTGTTPAVHGIIANNWYDKNSQELVYCAGDGNTHTVCNCEKQMKDVISEEGKMSPRHMLTTTIGDEIKLFNNESRVIGISLKDRGAILSTGALADGAYWLNHESKWITSSFYRKNLPEWVVRFHKKNSIESYMNKSWIGNNFEYDLNKILLETEELNCKNRN